MIDIGVVGAGFMAGTHVDRYAAIENARVRAVASPNSAGAFVADRELDADTYDDATAMFEAADLDAVDICTPTATHRALVEGAASRGLDVFCEKPLAHRAADLEAIQSAVDRADATCMVGHVVRFFPDYEAIREQVETGTIGSVGVARARRHIPPPGWADWYADESRSGGVLVDLAIHDIDYLRWLLGDVERVFARRTTAGDHEYAHAILRFEDAIGYVDASTGLGPGEGLSTELELAGTNGLLESSNDDSSLTIETTAGGDDELGNIPPNPVEQDGFHRELAAFIDCLETGSDPPVSIPDAKAAVRVALAATEAAATGRAVDPAEVGE